MKTEYIKEHIMDKEIPIWGYNYRPNSNYKFKPQILRRPAKGIIRNGTFYPLNEKGEIIRSQKIKYYNLEYALTEKEATDKYNELIDKHLEILEKIYVDIEMFKTDY